MVNKKEYLPAKAYVDTPIRSYGVILQPNNDKCQIVLVL